jgi:pimeloyl-ACP methyl ester carboxylesterase
VVSNRDSNLVPGRGARAPARIASRALLVGLLACGAAFAAGPAKIDLDAFEAQKKKVVLPDGVSLAYVPLGDPAGRAVVLIHGYTDSARDWVPLVPYLSARLRLILVDLRGHGRSDKPECCYTRWDFAYDVKLLLDALGVERADLVGHSLGSLIVQSFAENWPERARRVVLISSSGGPRAGSPPRKPAYDYASQIRQLREPLDPDSPFMVEWWASPTPVDEDFIRRERRDSAAIPLRVWLAVLDQGLVYEDLQRTLPRLRAPALLLWGSKDPIIEEEARQTLREALPQAQVKVFPGLGHNPIWEDPGACADVINAFLSAASADAARPISSTH